MARPEKRGLDYFPLDVDFMRDIKVRRINRKHGALGTVVIIELYSRIYHDNGYYLSWNEDICYDICDDLRVETPEQIQTIVDSCLQVGLFHAGLYNAQHVLTSNGVQCRYKACCVRRVSARILPELNLIECPQPQEESKPNEATKASEKALKTLTRSILEEIKVLEASELCATETELMYTETELMPTEMPQTKEKKKKGKERKREINLPQTPSQNGGGNEQMRVDRLEDYFSSFDDAFAKKIRNYDGLMEWFYAIGVCCLDEVVYEHKALITPLDNRAQRLTG